MHPDDEEFRRVAQEAEETFGPVEFVGWEVLGEGIDKSLRDFRVYTFRIVQTGEAAQGWMQRDGTPVVWPGREGPTQP